MKNASLTPTERCADAACKYPKTDGENAVDDRQVAGHVPQGSFGPLARQRQWGLRLRGQHAILEHEDANIIIAGRCGCGKVYIGADQSTA